MLSLRDSASTPVARAADIFGKNYIDIGVAYEMGLDPYHSQYSVVPLPESWLQRFADRGFVLMAIPGTTFMDLYNMEPYKFLWKDHLVGHEEAPVVFRQSHLRELALEDSVPSYMLITRWDGTVNMDLDNQVKKLPAGFRLPTVVEMSYLSLVGLKLKRDFNLGWIRTGETDSYGKSLLVNQFQHEVVISPFEQWQSSYRVSAAAVLSSNLDSMFSYS